MGLASRIITEDGWQPFFYVDHTLVSALTVRDSDIIAEINDGIESLGSKALFSALDADSDYWHSEINDEDVGRTVLVAHHGLCHFERMLFGLKSGPATFQGATNVIYVTAK